MERVIVNEGTKVNLYNLFEDLQNYTKLNNLRVLETLVDTFGINAATNIDGTVVSTDGSLLVGMGNNLGAQPGSYITVNAGDALTANLSWIQLTAPTTNIDVSSMQLGAHTLYLASTSSYSDPVDVLSGFALSLAGGGQKNTRVHDTYAFQWDINPTVSGVALAVVTIKLSRNRHCSNGNKCRGGPRKTK